MTRIYFRLLGVFVALAILAGGWCGCVRPISAPSGPTEKRQAQTPNGNPSVDAGSAPDAAIDEESATGEESALGDDCITYMCGEWTAGETACAPVPCTVARELEAFRERQKSEADSAAREQRKQGLQSF